jgi:adenylate cyclase
MQRRLAAILAIDVVGFSRLMGQNEAGTLDTLKELRKQLVAPQISSSRGRVFKLMGDGLLAEFGSVVDAVECAVAIQSAMPERNIDVEPGREILLRMGINLGDIIVEGSDIYGDGVNIAARLEGLADPGGICISSMVHHNVKSKLDLAFNDLGPQQVKNIAEPVHAYKIVLGELPAASRQSRSSQRLSVTDKSSIAVLPFNNMSDDASQDYFSDGISEDIITELSRFSSLDVIARNSSFVYKGQDVNITDVGKELGARYVVEGSVRKAGNRVRITVQLIDSSSGNHIWADRYDRELEDVFAVQDEITQIIVSILPGRMEAAGFERAKRKLPESLDVFDCLFKGRHHHYQGTVEDNAIALEALHSAISLDPGYAPAYAELACTYGQAWSRDYLEGDIAKTSCIKYAEKAYAIDENDVDCHRLLAEIRLIQQRHDSALRHHDRAYSMNPNDPRIVSQRGDLMTWMGNPQDGLEWIEKSNRLDPYAKDGRAYNLGRCHFTAREYDRAIAVLSGISTRQLPEELFLIASYSGSGNSELAIAMAEDLRRGSPEFSLSDYLLTVPYQKSEDLDHFRQCLIGAGFSE